MKFREGYTAPVGLAFDVVVGFVLAPVFFVEGFTIAVMYTDPPDYIDSLLAVCGCVWMLFFYLDSRGRVFKHYNAWLESQLPDEQSGEEKD